MAEAKGGTNESGGSSEGGREQTEQNGMDLRDDQKERSGEEESESIRIYIAYQTNYISITDGNVFVRGVTDLRYMDVNREDNALGLTRQTVVGLLATIEGIEIRREARKRENKPPLNERSLTTDCCESFFSLAHSSLGNHFTLKR